MKKYLLLISLAMFVTGMLSSCGNSNEKIIGQFEEIVQEMKETKNPAKMQTLAEQAQDILEDLDTLSLTKAQEAKLTELGAEFTEAYIKVTGDALNNAINSAMDAAQNALDGIEPMFDNDDVEEEPEDE